MRNREKSVRILMIRHGETQWNAEGRIQGYSDVPLSEAGRADVKGWCVPEDFASFRWCASPLVRARDTALLLGAPEDALALDHRLCEMHWGAWEGMTLEDLKHDMALIRDARARGGLDFCAPGGESQRDVQDRLRAWIADVVHHEHDTIAVAHKGVVRAMVSIATGWDMSRPMDRDLDWSCAHLFRATTDGALRIERLDIPLKVGG